MSSAPEFTVFLVGSDVLADRALQRHLSRLYSVRSVQSAAEVAKLMRSHAPGRENDSMTRALQETYHFDKLVFASEKMAEVCYLARRCGQRVAGRSERAAAVFGVRDWR